MRLILFGLIVFTWSIVSACGLFHKQERVKQAAASPGITAFKITLRYPSNAGRFGLQVVLIESNGRLSRNRGTGEAVFEKKVSQSELDSLIAAIKESDFFNQPDAFFTEDRDVRLSFLELEMDGKRKRIGFKNALPDPLRNLVSLMKRLAE